MNLNQHVHPVFADVINSFSAIPKTATADPKMEQYIQSLKDMDWHFEFSDDHGVWGRGHNQLSRLRLMQRSLDPKGEIWAQHAPQGNGIPKPI